VDTFFDYIQYEKRFSRHTVKAYRTDLSQFFAYAHAQYEIGDPAELSHTHVRSWIVHLIECGLSNTTINRKISCLKAFFSVSAENGRYDDQPYGQGNFATHGQKTSGFCGREKYGSPF
jgi:integrase/recombinase XerC